MLVWCGNLKILFISYRISLSIDLMNNFKHLNFKSYLDNDYDADRLIVQIESLQKLLNRTVELIRYIHQ